MSPLAKVTRFLVYVVAGVPLIIFSQYISPFHFGKVVIFRSLVEITAVLYIALIMKDRSYLPRTNLIFWAFLLFTGAFTLTTVTSFQPYNSFWGSLERMGGLWTFWHYFVYYVMLTGMLRTEKEWSTYVKLVLGAGFLSVLYGFGQKTTLSIFFGNGATRIFGTIGNAALFAGYELIAFFLGLAVYMNLPKTNMARKWLLGILGLTILAILMTAVRGSILGLGVGLLVFAFLYYRHTVSKQAKRLFLGLVAAAVLFLIVVFAFRNTSVIQNSAYLNRITDFSLTSYTVQTRFWAWQAGLNGWNDSPRTMLVGYGPENFDVPFSKYFNPQFFRGPGSETFFDRAHNMFVEVLVTMGLAGFITYVLLFVAAFMTLNRGRFRQKEMQLYKYSFIALLVGYMIHNSFIFDTSANFIIFFTVLGFISFLARDPAPEKHMPTPPRARAAAGFVGVVLMCLAWYLIYKTNIRAAEANYTTTRAIVAGANNDGGTAIQKYEEALKYNVAGIYDIRNRYAQWLLDNEPSPHNDVYTNAINSAIEAMKQNAALAPYEYLPELYLSRLYLTLGKDDPKSEYNDIALQHSLHALDLSPTFVRTYYEIAQGYLNKKDDAKAAEYFQKAAELNPDVGLSYWYWGVVLLDEGDNEKALEVIQQALDAGYGPTEDEYQKLYNLYYNLKDYTHLVLIQEGLVKVNPTNVQYRATLAALYAQLGRVDDAVSQARKAAELDPNFAGEAKQFVESLGREW